MPPTYYLGPEGTFSHILARKRFGSRGQLEGCDSIDAIFERVLATPGSQGLIPIENSSGGTVYDSVDMLLKNAGRIFMREELSLDVRIALLGHKGEAIKEIYSHFIQLKHHAEWLKANYPSAKLRPVVSTAIAAKKAAASKYAAALASPGAAEVYGLDILEKPESGSVVNVTHFCTIGTEPLPLTSTKQKSAYAAALPNTCGSLHRFLGPFARQEVSLTRIVSRPVPGKPQTYVFFFEIEGGPDDKPVAAALKRAGLLAESMTDLGTFPVGGRYKS